MYKALEVVDAFCCTEPNDIQFGVVYNPRWKLQENFKIGPSKRSTRLFEMVKKLTLEVDEKFLINVYRVGMNFEQTF